MLRLLCCFLAFIHLGWSANEYLHEKNHHGLVTTHQTHQAIPQQQQQHYEEHLSPKNYEKEYFFFSAPEEKLEQPKSLEKLTSSVKGHQQVIFIKNPENNAYKKAVENLVQNVVERKTHIYVLNKEPNHAAIKQKFQYIQQNINHKPEVKFITYHNSGDADRIQASIVQQYGGGVVKPLIANTKVFHTQSVLGNSSPVSKSYAKNALPSGVDVVPGSSYIPVV